MKKTITSALFLGAVLALASYPTFANNSSNNINNNDFSLNEENNSKNRIKQVSLGSKHSSAIATDNNGKDHLYTWGHNSSGELGLGTTNTQTTPQEVDINGNGTSGDEGIIKQVSLGRSHSSVITNDDDGKDHLYAWGANALGQLGLGDNAEETIYIPQKVNFDEKTIKKVSLGWYYSSVITNDGTNDHLYTWGYNFNGELGLGTTYDQNTPQEVDINGNGILGDEGIIKQVSLGGYHSAAITTDAGGDRLYIWGNNYYGQLGLRTTDEQTTPKEVDINQKGTLKQVSLGSTHSALITNDGENYHLYTWGNNSDGQLGLGTTDSQIIPQEVNINGNGTSEDK